MQRPDNPVGAFSPTPYSDAARLEMTKILADSPRELRELVSGLTESELETVYKNWTIRQIVHHLADSQVTAFIRVKLALTEKVPIVKPYSEGAWIELADTKTSPIEPSLQMFEGVHSRWVCLINSLSEVDLQRTYFHPEHGKVFDLWTTICLYAWHSQHHIGQIKWMRDFAIEKAVR